MIADIKHGCVVFIFCCLNVLVDEGHSSQLGCWICSYPVFFIPLLSSSLFFDKSYVEH